MLFYFKIYIFDVNNLKRREVKEMTVVNKCTRKDMEASLRKEAKRRFTVCSPEKCPLCRCSDG